MANPVVAEYGTIVANEAMARCLELQGSICDYRGTFTWGILIGFVLALVFHRIGRLINGRLQAKG